MRTLAIFLLAISIVFSACDSGNQTAENSEMLKNQADSLLKKVMDAHDEVMPQTLVLEKLKKNINARLDSVEVDSISSTEYNALIGKIDSAIIGMRDWMHDFEIPADTVSVRKMVDYYLEEINKMEKVKKLTFEVLPEAEEKLSELDSL
jgi:thioredoxin-related protein